MCRTVLEHRVAFRVSYFSFALVDDEVSAAESNRGMPKLAANVLCCNSLRCSRVMMWLDCTGVRIQVHDIQLKYTESSCRLSYIGILFPGDLLKNRRTTLLSSYSLQEFPACTSKNQSVHVIWPTVCPSERRRTDYFEKMQSDGVKWHQRCGFHVKVCFCYRECCSCDDVRYTYDLNSVMKAPRMREIRSSLSQKYEWIRVSVLVGSCCRLGQRAQVSEIFPQWKGLRVSISVECCSYLVSERESWGPCLNVLSGSRRVLSEVTSHFDRFWYEYWYRLFTRPRSVSSFGKINAGWPYWHAFEDVVERLYELTVWWKQLMCCAFEPSLRWQIMRESVSVLTWDNKLQCLINLHEHGSTRFLTDHFLH